MGARHRKPAMIGAGAMLAVAAVAGGIFAFSGTDSNAAEDCGGLDTALQNNLNFIAGQQANPDAQSEARIANRQAVVNLINQRRKAAGCGNNVQAQQPAKGQAATSGEDCGGLDKALQNNLNFIAGQKASPDSQSEARIANRQAVVDLIQQRRKAAGCKGDGGAADQGNANQGNANQGNNNQGNNAGNQGQATAPPAPKPDANQGNNGGASGQQVCKGSTVTLSGEGGAPAASSGEFPVGTTLKVTNLDNNKSTTVKVASVSGSCALLNNAAFEQVREPGKFLIRNAKIEKIG
jgi:hypothetical protein